MHEADESIREPVVRVIEAGCGGVEDIVELLEHSVPRLVGELTAADLVQGDAQTPYVRADVVLCGLRVYSLWLIWGWWGYSGGDGGYSGWGAILSGCRGDGVILSGCSK